MNAQDQWALYLDPDTHPDVRSEIASDLGEQETAALDRVGGILADEAVWGEPSAGLRERLLAQARSENRHHDDSPSPTGSGPDNELAKRRDRRPIGWYGAGLVTAAAAVLAFVLIANPLASGDTRTYEVAGTELTPDLVATVDVETQSAGVAITLNIQGLGPAEEATYYSAWLMQEGADGSMGDGSMDDDAMSDVGSMAMTPMVPVGSFHWREGGVPIELWSGVDTERFPLFIVTIQQEDDPPVASDVVVMTGRLDG